MPAKNKVMLIILDGWGLSPSESGNAPLLANTPVLDYVYATYPKTSLSASGLEVGISPGEPGNSEVGHMNIGSGRVSWENLPRVEQAIESGELAQNESLLNVFQNVKKNNSKLHFIGLVSDGGVHGHIHHLITLMEYAHKNGVKEVLVHFISDGRDTAPKVAETYVGQLEAAFKKTGVGRIATIVGRYFAMDRDNNWDRQKKAFNLFVANEGEKYESISAAIEASYKNDKSDEFIEPSVIGEGGTINENDGVVLFNYRSDRMRQLLSLFCGKENSNPPANLSIVTMTQFENNQTVPVLFGPINMANTLSEVIASNGLTQFHTAETEKFAHVTYFFNGGKEGAQPKETDMIVPSKKVPSYDRLPEMSAPEVTAKVIKGIKENNDFIVVNYANGDMVGHTGSLKAAIKACEDVDVFLKEVFIEAAKSNYRIFITADHGNCEAMIDEVTKEPNKEHTTNPVPFVFMDFEKHPFNWENIGFSKDDYIQYAVGTPIGVLADIAPSILANLGLGQPEEMTGMDLSIAMI